MSKQYLDGSIPTGFQRTAMMGLAGAIPFRVPSLGVDREFRIRQLSLEEDSCREVSDVGHRITFRTDRLGTPLTEVVTEPDFLTPWEVREGGRLIASVARATGKVRRGAGAARQDVNVSVAGGRRVEIKGVPHHKGLPLLVHVEAFRQLNLLRIREELLRRGVTADLLALIARALLCNPALVLADEPTTNLDVTSQAQILDLLIELKNRFHMAMILVTHDMGVVARMADRIVVMYAGRICEDANAKVIFPEPRHPYTRALLETMPRVDQSYAGDSQNRLVVIRGRIANLVDPPTGCRFHPRCAVAMPECSTILPEPVDVADGHAVSCLKYSGGRTAS